MKFTGNELIDKHIKRGLSPMDRVNMDDYYDRHPTFLEHISNVGSDSQLKDDRSDKIRNYIAKDGYYLDQYVNDESAYVREAVAKNGYGLDQLIHDTDEYVLTNVAEHGYGLDELKTHPSPFIRGMVASKGYQPELFIHDPSKMVRQIAQPILTELEWERDHTLTLDDLSSLTQDSNIKSKGF